MGRIRRSPIALIALAAATGLMAAALLLDWLVVDVRTAEGPRVALAVPVAAVRTAVALLPARLLPDRDLPPEAAADLRVAAGLLHELARAPSGTRVRVASPDASVLVAAGDGAVVADVHAPGSEVHVRLPLLGLARALERWDARRLDRAALDVLLAALADGFEVRVADRETRVRVTVR